jgi:3-deoxy-7-phosphoheptulonate synthase
MTRVSDVHVIANTALPSPRELSVEIPRSEAHAAFVAGARADISRVITGEDSRFVLIVGPCSIHDLKCGREYAERLAKLAEEVRDRVLVVMRVYFEKPRTTVGWKGLIMDPHLDGTNDIPAGLRIARSFLRDVLDLGLPTATEMHDGVANAPADGERAFDARWFQKYDERRGDPGAQCDQGSDAAADFPRH